MRYKLLGRSGLRVSDFCLGTMTFGEEWGWGASKQESKKMFDAFAGAGGNFIDTANRYTDGTSERYVGEFIASERERFVVATKYSLYMRKGDPNSAGNHRKNMMQSLEASLARLRTPYIDLYWLHAWDFMTPEEEVLRALDDMVRQGKILYIGISDTPAWIVSRMNAIADLRGWTAFTALQIEYSLIQRTVEREYLPMARALDLAVAAWAPLGGGALTGKYLEAGEEAERADSTRAVPGATSATGPSPQEVVAVAREVGCSPVHVALRWLLARDGVIIPIVGARKVEQLKDSLASIEVTVNSDYLNRLDAGQRH